MKTMFDTSVLIPSLLPRHPFHQKAVQWWRRGLAGEFACYSAAHSLAECYAVLTAKVGTLGLEPLIVEKTIRQNLTSGAFNVIELSTADYLASIEKVAALGLWSGIIYDALLVTAAEKAGVERLLTFNAKHFHQVWPSAGSVITVP